jgi:hypothetical protein
LWWDYVERFQLGGRPAGTSLIEFQASLHDRPVYYHNHLLGDCLPPSYGIV